MLVKDDLSEIKLGTDSAMDRELGSSFGSGGSPCCFGCGALSRRWSDWDGVAFCGFDAAVEGRELEADVVVGRECER